MHILDFKTFDELIYAIDLNPTKWASMSLFV